MFYSFPDHIENIRVCAPTKLLFERFTDTLFTRGVMGDVAEAGCFHGGISARMAWLIHEYQRADTTVYALDTFDGFHEADVDGGTVTPGAFSQDEVPLTVLESLSDSLPIVPIRGDLRETKDLLKDKTFAFVFIDLDISPLIRCALEFFVPRMTLGGIICVDDYRTRQTPGVQPAVHEFISGSNPLCRVCDLNPSTRQIFLEVKSHARNAT